MGSLAPRPPSPDLRRRHANSRDYSLQPPQESPEPLLASQPSPELLPTHDNCILAAHVLLPPQILFCESNTCAKQEFLARASPASNEPASQDFSLLDPHASAAPSPSAETPPSVHNSEAHSTSLMTQDSTTSFTSPPSPPANPSLVETEAATTSQPVTLAAHQAETPPPVHSSEAHSTSLMMQDPTTSFTSPPLPPANPSLVETGATTTSQPVTLAAQQAACDVNVPPPPTPGTPRPPRKSRFGPQVNDPVINEQRLQDFLRRLGQPDPEPTSPAAIKRHRHHDDDSPPDPSPEGQGKRVHASYAAALTLGATPASPASKRNRNPSPTPDSSGRPKRSAALASAAPASPATRRQTKGNTQATPLTGANEVPLGNQQPTVNKSPKKPRADTWSTWTNPNTVDKEPTPPPTPPPKTKTKAKAKRERKPKRDAANPTNIDATLVPDNAPPSDHLPGGVTTWTNNTCSICKTDNLRNDSQMLEHFLAHHAVDGVSTTTDAALQAHGLESCATCGKIDKLGIVHKNDKCRVATYRTSAKYLASRKAALQQAVTPDDIINMQPSEDLIDLDDLFTEPTGHRNDLRHNKLLQEDLRIVTIAAVRAIKTASSPRESSAAWTYLPQLPTLALSGKSSDADISCRLGLLLIGKHQQLLVDHNTQQLLHRRQQPTQQLDDESTALAANKLLHASGDVGKTARRLLEPSTVVNFTDDGVAEQVALLLINDSAAQQVPELAQTHPNHLSSTKTWSSGPCNAPRTPAPASPGGARHTSRP